MSFKAINWAVDDVRLDNAVDKLVLILLANRHNGDTGRCDASHTRIAEEAGVNRTTVLRATKRLEQQGLLTISGRSGKTHQYDLHLDRPVEETNMLNKRTCSSGQQVPVEQVNRGCCTGQHEPLLTVNKPFSPKNKFSDDHYAAAKDMSLTLGLKKPPNLDKWADTFRLMEEKDQISPSEALRVFYLAHADEFWSSNILSPEKLRKQYEQLNRKLSPRVKTNPAKKRTTYQDNG